MNNNTDRVKPFLIDYIHEITDRSKGMNQYICPFCNSGTGRKRTGAFTFYPATNTYTCFACGESGDIFTLYGKMNNLSTVSDFPEIMDALEKKYNLPSSENSEMLSHTPQSHLTALSDKPSVITLPETDTQKKASENVSEVQEYDFTDYYRKCVQNLKRSPEAVTYLEKRGISLETALKYWVGFDPSADPASAPDGKGEKKHPRGRLILPVSSGYYVGRAIDGNEEYAKVNPKGAKSDIFNLKALQKAENNVIFVVEGYFDALSVIEAGYDAIALNSTSNAEMLLKRLQDGGTDKGIVICLDNDKAGKTASETLAEGLGSSGIDFTRADICGDFKDPNEALVSDRDSFRMTVENVVQTAQKKFGQLHRPDSVSDYINTVMSDEIEELKKYRHLKTGYSNIDSIIGNLYPDLYVIGAISSLGKTTFCVQMADQIASMGTDVLFFSLEQSRLEIVSKCIARRTAQNDAKSAVTSLSVRRGYLPENVLEASREFSSDVQERFSVIEGDFENNISSIRDYVRRYIAVNHTRPVVFVDYLQILQPTNERTQTTKEAVDEIIKTLKQISKREKITVFAVSSLNRSNYLAPVDFESFKESGLIEYTAGVVWGLQLQVMNSELFSAKEKNIVKRNAVRTEKKRNPRLVELVCLKNRYGQANFSAYFEYYPQFDLFEPSECYFYDSNGGLTNTKLHSDNDLPSTSVNSTGSIVYIDPSTGEAVPEHERKKGVAYIISRQ